MDVTRGLLWILLPGALAGALLLVWQGVPMNFHPYAVAATAEDGRQAIPQGPVAALEIIKNLGTNGGGFFSERGASVRKSHWLGESPGNAGYCALARSFD